MQPLNKNQKLLLTIGIGLIIAILFVALIIYPQTSSILQMNNQIQNEKMQLEQLDTKESDISKFKDKESEVDFIVDQLAAHLTTQEDILDFIVQLEEIAGNTNNKQEIKIQEGEEEVKPKAKKTEDETGQDTTVKNPLDDLDSINVEVNLEGDYNSLINYLIELEKSDILTDQTSLDAFLEGLDQALPNTPLTEEDEAFTGNLLTTQIQLKAFLAK